MAEICNPSCNNSQIRTYPIPCSMTESTRKGGFERFILLDCDAVITSLVDANEWQTLINNNRLVVSPKGFGKLINPDLKKELLSACSPEQVIDEIAGFEWFTKLFDNVTYFDFDFENDVKSSYSSKNVLWIGCDGLLYFNYKWTAGTNPGFGNISAEVSRTSEAGNLQQLNINVKFNNYQKGLKGILLPQSVLNVITSGTPTT